MMVKLLIRDNVGVDGGLDTVKFARAMLEHRNTPDCPAQVLYDR